MSEHHLGVHTLTEEQYRKSSGVSGSMLEVIRNDSPFHLKAILDGTAEPEETEATSFGTLFHAWVVDPGSVLSKVHLKPKGMSFATKEGREWKKAHSDREIVEEEDIAHMRGMTSALRENKLFMKLYRGGRPEQAVFAQDSQGTLRKGRLDYLNGGNYVLDFKTLQSAKPGRVAHDIDKRGYDRRMSWYCDLCNYAGLTPKKEIAYLVVVEKKPPYVNKVYRLDQLWLSYGRKMYQRDLAIYRKCVETGIWPAYENDEELIGPHLLPPWKLKEIENIG